VVVPTHSVVAGLAALSVFEPAVGAAANAGPMAQAAASVVAGEVTVAVRDSLAQVGSITAGDWLGVHDGDVLAAGPDPVGVVTALVAGLLEMVAGGGAELVTVFTGEGATSEVTAALTAWLGDVHPDIDVEVHHGGQPLYPYLIGIQ
jgi:dihydroxyacetone kinase-like predicted kinase